MLRACTRILRRVAVTVLGAAILATGVVLLVLPGPGFLVIALGFLVLGIEYEWARRHFRTARTKAAGLARQAAADRRSTAFTVLAALALVAVGVLLGVRDDLPASGWWTGGTLIVSGAIALGSIIAALVGASRSRAGEPAPD